jgi:hypothetical protein
MSINQVTIQNITKKLSLLSSHLSDYGDEMTPHINHQLTQFDDYLSFVQRQRAVCQTKRSSYTLVSLKQSRAHIGVAAVTPLEKSSQPANIESLLGTLRGTWNKLCENNFFVLRDKLCLHLEELNSLPDLAASQVAVADMLFDMATHHRLYTEVYAKMWHVLSARYAFLHDRVTKHIPTYMEHLARIRTLNPDTDYNAFCANNVMKERVRATTKFILHYAKHNPSKGLEILISTQNLLLSMVEREDFIGSPVQDEVLLLLCIMLREKTTLEETEDVPEWKVMIKERLETYVHGTHVSNICSRVRFTIRDALSSIVDVDVNSTWEIVPQNNHHV